MLAQAKEGWEKQGHVLLVLPWPSESRPVV